MANAYYYSNTAVQTTLSGSISNSATSLNVAATTGFPVSYPYILALDYGSSTEELVSVTSAAGLTLTVVRGFGGTSAQSHSIGAVVRHVYNATDATDFRTHEAASAAVHGLTGTVVGTTDSQTLTNKTITSPSIGGTVSGSATYTTPTITSPTISGTVAGGASYTAPTITSPTITGTVAGGASYTSPTITGTVAGGASYTAPTLTGTVTASAATISSPTIRDATAVNSAIGVVPVTVNAIAATTADLIKAQFNGTDRWRILPDGASRLTPANTAINGYFVNAASGFVGNLGDWQLNSVSKFSVDQSGNGANAGTWTATGKVTGLSFQATSMASSSFENTTNFSTASTSYSDMSGSLTVTVPPSGKVHVSAYSQMFGNLTNADMYAAVVVTGSTTGTIRAAADNTAMYMRQNNSGNQAVTTSAQSFIVTSANIGETLTIKIQGRVGAGAVGATVASAVRGVTAIPLLQ